MIDVELRPLVDVMKSVGVMAKACQRELVGKSMAKQDRSPVTLCDYAIQAVIAKALLDHFPQDSLVAEEDAEDLRKSENRSTLEGVISLVRRVCSEADSEAVIDWIDHGQGEPGRRFWTLDPIDGTKGFLRGDHFSTGLALVEAGQVVLAILSCPTVENLAGRVSKSGFLIFAKLGKGAWASPIANENWVQLKVSDRDDWAKVVLVQSLDTDHHNASRAGRVYEGLGGSRPILKMDSFVKAVIVASGDADIFCRMPPERDEGYRENIWDQAASSFVAKEAGAKVSDLNGSALDFSCGKKMLNNEGILMTNGRIHDVVLDKIKEVRKARL